MNVPVFVAVASATLVAPAAMAQAIACPSFETCVPQSVLQTVAGIWGGDVTSVVGVDGAVTPHDGSLMLKFGTTAPTDSSTGGGPGSGTGGDLIQMIDVTPMLADIQAGNVVVHHGAWFNRIAGDSQTDTEFGVFMSAYDGDPSTWKTGPTTSRPFLETTGEYVETDADTQTWEFIETQMLLPPGTTFIAVSVNSRENIFNDFSGLEFDGHYADKVETVFVVTCPGDLNADGVVDGADLAELLAAWGSGGVPADLDMSGTVDGADLAALLASWGACT